jgi:hypothetical protein
VVGLERVVGLLVGPVAHRARLIVPRCSSSRSLAMSAAIRRASSRVSSLAAVRRPEARRAPKRVAVRLGPRQSPFSTHLGPPPTASVVPLVRARARAQVEVHILLAADIRAAVRIPVVVRIREVAGSKPSRSANTYGPRDRDGNPAGKDMPHTGSA